DGLDGLNGPSGLADLDDDEGYVPYDYLPASWETAPTPSTPPAPRPAPAPRPDTEPPRPSGTTGAEREATPKDTP
ncbi:hypothetical protein ACWDO3_21665, partial [Streptomyces hydrogenans]